MSWDYLRRTLVVVVVLSSGACATEREGALQRDQTSPESTSTSPPAAAVGEGMELLWSVEDLQFVSSPQAARAGGDDIAVTVVADEAGLAVTAYDVTTGEERWRRPTTASRLTAGVLLRPVVDGDRVYHLVEGENGDSVEAVDAGSGDVVWTSEPTGSGFSDRLRPCDRTVTSLCITDGDGPWTVDADDGEVTESSGEIVETAFGRPTRQNSGSRYLGADLYELDNGDIARVVEGEVVWQHPPSELFGGKDVAPDWGWSFDEVDDLIVGWLGNVLDLDAEGELPLTESYIAGIEAATGEPRWVEPGYLHCAGLAVILGGGFSGPSWFRCEATGTMFVEDFESRDWTIETSTLEGFDPATGKATWTVDMGAASALFDEEGVLLRIDASTFALRRDDGMQLVVDTADGSQPSLGADVVGWCFVPNPYDDDGYERVGVPLTNPCNLDGERQPVPSEPDDYLGIEATGVFVWIDEAGLHGAR